MFRKFINRVVSFLQSNEGVAVIETSFILPILIFLLIFFVEMHLFIQARQSVLLLAYECARDFCVSGRINSFDNNIQKFTSVLLGADDAVSLQKKLCYYIHLHSEIDNMCAYPLFFDADGDGRFQKNGQDEVISSDENLLSIKQEPEMYIGSKSYVIYGKHKFIPADDEFCFWDAADLAKPNPELSDIRYGTIVFVYRFKFIFPLFGYLISGKRAGEEGKKLESVPIVCSAPIIRDF